MDGGLGSRPEHGRAAHAVLLCGDPDRFCLVPPATVIGGLPVAQAETDSRNLAVLHRVADNAVAIGPQSGHQRVVVGKGYRRKRWPHGLGPGALRRKGVEVRRDPTGQVIGLETVNRYQDQRRRGLPGLH